MTRIKQTFYFYIIHGCKAVIDKRSATHDFNYLETVGTALKNKSAFTLQLANDVQDIISERRDRYSLGNGIDVRELYFTGEIKQISEEGYNEILEDDERIMANMSDKEKDLLTKFGFDLEGWHRPFKIEAKNKIYLKRALVRKLGYSPIVLFKENL
jgi:hypothetical protein